MWSVTLSPLRILFSCFFLLRVDAETLLGLATGAKQEPESLVVKQVEVVKSEPAVQHQTDQLPCHEAVGVNGDNLDRVSTTQASGQTI